MDDVPANPFDCEDPERFAPVEMPVEPDIVYMLGVRMESIRGGIWRCPHGSYYDGAIPGALSCLNRHEEEGTP